MGCASHLGVLYAVGGECAMADAQDDTQYLRHVEYCDLSSTEWLECSPMKVARSFVSVCELGNYLYAVGEYKLYPYPAAWLIYFNFQPLEVVYRYSDPQPQVVENYSYLFNLRPNIYKS